MCIIAAAPALGISAAGAAAMNVGIALSVASSAAMFAQQRSAAKAQAAQQSANARITNKYNQQVYDRGMAQYDQESQYRAELIQNRHDMYVENADRAVDDAHRNYDLIQDRIEQENIVASLEIDKITRDSRAVQGQVIVDAADRGVEGASVDYLLDAIAFNELQGAQNVRMEREWRHTSLLGSMDEIEAQTQARIDSMNPQPVPLPALPAPMAPTMVAPPVTPPSLFTAFTNAASGVLNAYATFSNPQMMGATGSGTATGGYSPQNVGMSTYRPATGSGWANRWASGGGMGGWRTRMNAWGG